MKRYAAHYIYHPDRGYLKQSLVEVDHGKVLNIKTLEEEEEDVEWYPGVIELVYNEACGHWIPYLYYPFDFKTMQPVAGTQRRLLQ